MVPGSKPLKAGYDYPTSGDEFDEWFRTNEACREFLFWLRWGGSWECESCQGSKMWWVGPTAFRCTSCRREYSVMAGTIFERSQTALPLWFKAAWRIAAEKQGISATTLQKTIGCGSMQTAWMMLHRYRRAMVFANRSKLKSSTDGWVEIDETSIGGPRPGKRGRGAAGKTKVLIMVECYPKGGFGRVRLKIIATADQKTLMNEITDAVESGSLIRTDAHAGYNPLPQYGYTHEVINLSDSNAGPAHEELEGVHRVASHLKRWLLGTHQGGVRSDHLQEYLEEFTFRWNRRRGANDGLIFHRLMEGAVAHDPVTYEAVVTRFRKTRRTKKPVAPKRRSAAAKAADAKPVAPWREGLARDGRG